MYVNPFQYLTYQMWSQFPRQMRTSVSSMTLRADSDSTASGMMRQRLVSHLSVVYVESIISSQYVKTNKLYYIIS